MKAKYGPSYFSRIGRLGGRPTWQEELAKAREKGARLGKLAWNTLNKSAAMGLIRAGRADAIAEVSEVHPPTFADLKYHGKKRKTRRALFLERMYVLIPGQLLEERIRPLYPKAGRGGHPDPLQAMLRVHCVQLFYNLSDPGIEDLLYESDTVRRFVGLKLTGPLPDETTILNFRHLLER